MGMAWNAVIGDGGEEGGDGDSGDDEMVEVRRAVMEEMEMMR